MLAKSTKSGKFPQDEWSCHCCTAKNSPEAAKCRVCGRLESYALQGYGLPFHGKNSTLFRPTQILTVLEDIHEVDSEQWSALHSACASGNFQVMKDLLSLKAKVEALTNKGQTPLQLAIYSGSLDCVNELLKYGANPNVSTVHEKCTPLHLACQKGFAQIAVALVDHGANVNALNVLNRTPLHMAAEAGRIDIGKYLIAHGADREALDVHGWSVRQIAELFNHRDFQELIIRETMVEKQVIIKELPVAEWHSELWFDVTRMHAQRIEELQIRNETKQHDHNLLISLQKSKKDKIIAARRAERQLEIAEYNARKNHAKEMALQYAEKLTVGHTKNTKTDKDKTMTITEDVSLPTLPAADTHLTSELVIVTESTGMRVNTAEKLSPGRRKSRSGYGNRVSISEGTSNGIDNHFPSKPNSRIGTAGMMAVTGGL